MHALDLAHLALHPGNVMLDSHTRVRLADYALPMELLVKRRERVETMDPPSELLEEHQLYSAPELLRAMVGLTTEEDESLAPSDIWSLGCIVLRLLTLMAPYADATIDAEQKDRPISMLGHTLPKIAAGELHPASNLNDALHPWKPSEPAVPPQAATLIRRCTEAEPVKRPSALEAFELLSTTVKRNARKMSAVPLPMPSQKQPGGVLHASLERSSVGEALGLEDDSSASVHASLKRGSVGEALGLEDFSLAAFVHASLERDSVGEALGLNATPADDVSNDGAATFRDVGRTQPARLPRRKRGEQQPAKAPDDDDGEELNAGRAQPARLPTRKRGEQPAKAPDDDEKEEELNGGRAQPARLPTRKRGGQQPANALDDDEEEELKSGGRAQPARLPTRKRGEQPKAWKHQDEALPELEEEELKAGGRAQPARLQMRKRGEQRKVWKQPSSEPRVDDHDGQEAAQERLRPKRLPPRSTTERLQANAQHGQHGAKHGASPLSDQQLVSPRVRI